MSLKRLYFVVSFVLFSSLAQGQEICNNGLDDDLDGFVDCYDRDCVESAACEDAFVEGDPSCEVVPSEFPTFSLNLNYASPNGTSSNNGLSAIGDVDGDGINEIVTTNTGTDMIYVLDGRDGSIKYSRDVGSGPSMEVMIGDVNRDGFAEIFVPFSNRIRAYNHDLTVELWDEPTTANPGNMGLADFDADGRVELYARDQIFDALTGDLLHASDYDSDDIKRNITLGPIAVDILDDTECTNCAGLELIAGGLIYSVDIDRTVNTASLNLERRIEDESGNLNYEPQYSGSLGMNRTGTSVADYNKDGYLDVLTSGNTPDDPSLTKIFFWDVKNDSVKIYYDPSYNWDKGTGRLNIADIDGDGQLNVTYVTGAYLYALDENFEFFWRSAILENTSGTTGTTVFDFNGDGKFETVYRDEQWLYIVDGTTGNFFTQIRCSSLTYTEYPIVADVDGDGATEICVSCLTNDDGSIWNTAPGQIRVFESNGEDWVPARKVWNQHGYFNVNVNDDLTIPRQMQKHHLTFSEGVCDTGGPRQPLNTFLNQAPYLTVDGCANYSAPDLGFMGDTESSLTVNEPNCPETEFTISFSLKNEGDREVSASVPITFYEGDPMASGATVLETQWIFVTIPAGGTTEVNDIVVPGTGSQFELYVSLNDDGTQTSPISFPAGGILECDYGDNIRAITVDIAPAELIVTKLADNNRCSTGTGEDNGAAQAAVNAPETVWLEDFEDLDEDENDDSGSTAWDADDGETNRLDGDMKFRVRDDRATWESEVIDISAYTSADLSVDLYQEGDMEDEDYVRVYYVLDGGAETQFNNNGDNTGNFGTSRATATGLTGSTIQIIIKSRNSNRDERHYFDNISLKGFGNATAGYTFYWYAGGTVSGTPIHTGSVATGLVEGDYAVRAVYSAGCSSDTAVVTIERTSVIPEVSINIVQSLTNCNNPDGALEAVVNGGVASDYEFEWYDGLDIFTSPQIGNAALVSGLEARAYTVLVTDKISGCQSIETETVPSEVPIPVVSPTVIAHVTDCANPASGEASAIVNGQGILWLENFNDLDENTDEDNGATAWSRWERADYAETRDLGGDMKFAVRDGRATWESAVIDIAGFTGVDLSVDIYEEGRMEWNDQVEVYYVLDGGSEILFSDNGTNTGDFGAEQATVDDLTGNTVQIIIKSDNSSNSERHYFDNISVEGVGNFVNGYTFEWFAGTALKPSPDFTGISVTGLAAGDYLVRAVSDVTGCVSDPVPFIINDETTSPVITAAVTAHQTSCDAVAPNGSVEANVGGTTTGYTFEWYTGQTTNSTYELPGSPSPSLNGLGAGIYTVKAIDDANNCFSTAEVIIEDQRDTVTVSANITHQTYCIPANGELTATAADGNGTYTYYWFNGAVGTPDITAADFTGATYTNLVAGDYTVMAVDGNTCASEPETFRLDDNTIAPVVTADSVNNSSCDPAAFNGRVRADVGGTTSGYTFQWFEGANTDPANELSASPAAAINGLAANVYTVLATDNTTGCTQSEPVTVIDISQKIALTLDSIPNSVCDASLGFTGQVIATKTDVNGQPGDSYVYELFDELGNSILTQTDDPVFTGLEDGKYFVQVSNITLKCSSDLVSITVESTKVIPDLSVSQTPMTSCSAANGAATASVAGGNSADYEFEWFVGHGMGGSPFETGPTATGLDGTAGSNEYTVLVTNKTTGCFATEYVTITDESSLPTLTMTSTHNEVCDPAAGIKDDFTGTITVTKDHVNHQNGDTYTYTLYNNAGDSLTSQTDSVFTALVDGDYLVTVTNDRLGCKSDPVSVTIEEPDPFPAIDVSDTPMTTCSGTPNGAATATAGGETAGFTFIWYRGNSTNSADSISTGPSIANLDGTAGSNSYTVLVINDSTGCSDELLFTIDDNSELPVVANSVSTPNTMCDPLKYNGSITVPVTDINNESGDSYEYQLLQGGVVKATATVVNTSYTFGNLAGGDYDVLVTNLRLGCASDPVAVTVDDEQVFPAIELDTTHMTTCAGITPNGAASADVGDSTSGYDFEWYEGSASAGTLIGTGPTIEELDGTYGNNDYTVKVINQLTGCFSTLAFQIQNRSEKPILMPKDTLPSTVCDPSIGYDGEITLDVEYKNNIVTGSDDYVFTWYNGTAATPGNENTGSTDEVLSALDSGSYTAVVVDTALNCTSDPLTVEVLAEKYKPFISFTKKAQTSCNPAAPNGRLVALIDDSSIGGTGDPAEYTFTWYEGIGTGTAVSSPAVQGGDGEQLDKLAENDYTVEVVRDATGCVNTKAVFLPEEKTIPVVQIADNTAVTICSDPAGNGPNGFLRAEADGAEDYYTFHWMIGEETLSSEVIANADSVRSDDGRLFRLFPSNYTVVAVSDTSECVSQPVSVEVQDDTKPIAIDVSFDIVPTACGVNEGQITADPSYDGVSSPADFNYEWYAGGPTNDSINFYTNPPVFDPNTPSGTTASYAGLASGLYTIVVEHQATGCKQYGIEFLPFLDAHEVDTTLVNSTICPYDVGNGQVAISIKPPATAAAAGIDNSGYEVWVYEGSDDNGSIKIDSLRPAPGTDSIALGTDDYAPGFYTIVVQETYTGQDCETFTVVEIGADARAPVVNDTTFANTSCGPFDGSVQFDVSKHPDDITPDGTFTAMINPDPNSASPQNGDLNGTGDNAIFDGLNSGSYTFTVTDDSSACFVTKEVFVENQPAIAELTSNDVAITHEALCFTSGGAEVQTIKLQDGTAELVTDYEFTWYDAANNVIKTATAGDGAVDQAGGDYSGLVGSGTYYVTAQKVVDNSGNGGLNCTTVPFEVTIDDLATDPQLNLTAFSNTSCNPLVDEGSIDMAITDEYAESIDPAFDDAFTITITGTGGPYSPIYTVGTTTQANLTDDTYSVHVVNDNTGCFVEKPVTIELNEQPLIISETTAKDQELCDPDGEIEVNEITLYGIDSDGDGNYDTDNLANYSFAWYADEARTIPVGNTAGINGLTAGDYYVVAKKIAGSPGAGCESTVQKTIIQDVSEDPTVALTAFDNTSCDNTLLKEGSIVYEITDVYSRDSLGFATPDFTVNITGAENRTFANIATLKDSVVNLAEGDYKIEIENNKTGCSTPARIVTIEQRAPKFVLSASTRDKLLCNPSGIITIDEVTMDGAPVSGTDFTYKWSSPTTPDLGVTGDQLDSANYTGIDAGVEYTVVATRNSGFPGTACESDVLEVELKENIAYPTLDFTMVTNTACDLSVISVDGALAVEVTDNGAVISDYDYIWNSHPGTHPGDEISEGDSLNFTNLKPGTYQLTVTSNGTGCTVTGTKTVESQEVYPVFTAGISHQDLCDPSGSITVNSATPGAISDYTLAWSRESITAATPMDTVTGPVLDVANYATIEADTYIITGRKEAGTNGPGDGCSTTFNEIIDDISVDPRMTFETVSNHACDLAFADGEIEVIVTDDSDVGDVTDFTYWFNTPDTDAPDRTAVSANETWTALEPGTYTFTVESNGTGCKQTGSITIEDDPAVVTIEPTDLALSPNLNCDPAYNGTAIVQMVTEDGDQFIPGNYEYEWFDENGTISGPSTTNSINVLDSGSYSVRVTNTTTRCFNINPIAFEIEDGTEVPVVAAASLIDNVNCAGITPDGEITLDINGGADPSDYAITWYTDAARTTPVSAAMISGVNGEQLISVPGGSYYMEVTDNAAFIGCSTTGKVAIEDDLAVITIAKNDITLNPNTICDPAYATTTFNGAATVVTVTEDGNATATANYNFEWLDINENAVPGSTPSNSISVLDAGTYYVRAVNRTTNCENIVPSEFVIEDETIKPDIRLEDFGNPTRCETVNAMGYLQVSADNSTSTTDYNFAWFDGDPATGVQVGTEAELNGRAEGNYHVVVTNNATGCRNTANYILETEVKEVRVNVSSRPVTFCNEDNGQLFAKVIGGNHYSYEWYAGQAAGGSASYNQAQVTNVAGGDYTVVAIDNNDPFCKSEPASVFVEVLKEYPDVLAELDKQLTNCDPANPNGAVTAIVNDLTKVDFYWYAGTDTTAAHFSNEPALEGIELGMYKVVVVDKATQCAGSAVVEVTDGTILPDTPTIDVVNHNFSCVEPNGMLTGHIDGRTSGYAFNWYEGNEASGTVMTESPGFNGLDVGNYTVVAVNEKTGCRSMPATAAIEDDREYPEFDFRIENATCDNENGAVYIVYKEDQTYNDFAWDVNGRTVKAPFIADVAAGNYEVTVTGRGDCPTSKVATVGTEIHAFNGLSPNGDGENEYFHIACIGSFENNTVKIYNRAGQIVYEGRGYDNHDVRFEGKGNRGIYITSNNLPDGTYFYIVDRGDGQKPSSGYLELVR